MNLVVFDDELLFKFVSDENCEETDFTFTEVGAMDKILIGLLTNDLLNKNCND